MLGLDSGWAANDPSRLALVIGNSAYANSPLSNPINDARAVTGLLTEAGFTINSHLDANRADMMGAIERFGTAIKRSETKLVLFYYAGHGVQLDWRNYLLPIDAAVTKEEDIRLQCVDLNHLMGLFGATKDKTFVVILDACRDNPFGSTHRAAQKGLSQFDAPVGSLLAYATSPGSVAADGDGKNGLYTENLVRELSQHGTRIEDALKRVRLNVRLASKGAQIPWETTSLESDVFIFNEGQKKPSESELEKLIEADVTEWARIKSSRVTEDWVRYLRSFPNGRFAEIAQLRLSRLLADSESARLLTLSAASSAPAPDPALEYQAQLAAVSAQQKRLEQQKQDAVEAEKLAAEKRRKDEQLAQQEQARINQLRIENERIRVANEQRLAAERKELEEHQQRLAVQQADTIARKEEQEKLDRESQMIADAARVAAQRQQQEEQRLLEEEKRLRQEKLDRDRLDAERLATERQLHEEMRLRLEKEQQALAGSTIDIGPGLAVPMLIAPSVNPFSAGRYPLGRIYTVGDTATIRVIDLLTGVESEVVTKRVTKVDIEADRVEFNGGRNVSDSMGNVIKSSRRSHDQPLQLNPAEFQIGKKWRATFRSIRTDMGWVEVGHYELQVIKRETILVRAGTFDTFLVQGKGFRVRNEGLGLSTKRIELDIWLVPGLNFAVRSDTRLRSLMSFEAEREELVSMHQQVFHAAV